MDEQALCEALVDYLSGERKADLKAQEIYRQLSKRLLSSLADSEETRLRENPDAHRSHLLHVLSLALQEDPVARRLVSQLTPSETTERPDQRPSTGSARGDHIEIRGNGNLLAHGKFGNGNIFATGPFGNGSVVGGSGNVGVQGKGNTVGSSISQVKETPLFSSGSAEPRPSSPDTRSAAAPIRILFLTAAPDGMGLRTDHEIRDVLEALRQSKFGERFDLIQEPAVRLRDFQRTILQHRPDILHFSGHGYGGAISLEGQDGKDWQVEGCDLADLFSILQGQTRCLVLNACYTAEQADLIAQKIDAVIAYPVAVRDSAARIFSIYFYQALGFGSSVREAFDLACLQLRLEGGGGGANPVLLAKRCDPAEIRFVNGTSPSAD